MIIFLRTYQLFSLSFHFLSQMFGLPCHCKFVPTCSEFAVQEFSNKNQSALKSLSRVCRRIASCSPLSR